MAGVVAVSAVAAISGAFYVYRYRRSMSMTEAAAGAGGEAADVSLAEVIQQSHAAAVADGMNTETPQGMSHPYYHEL